eukprot:83272-Rhodomonas_salina.5
MRSAGSCMQISGGGRDVESRALLVPPPWRGALLSFFLSSSSLLPLFFLSSASSLRAPPLSLSLPFHFLNALPRTPEAAAVRPLVLLHLFVQVAESEPPLFHHAHAIAAASYPPQDLRTWLSSSAPCVTNTLLCSSSRVSHSTTPGTDPSETLPLTPCGESVWRTSALRAPMQQQQTKCCIQLGPDDAASCVRFRRQQCCHVACHEGAVGGVHGWSSVVTRGGEERGHVTRTGRGPTHALQHVLKTR